jgi:hypothetical protein
MKKVFALALLIFATTSFGQATRLYDKIASRQSAHVEILGANKVVTYLDAETQLFSPTADRDVTLPSANVWAGWKIKIIDESATYKLTIKSSAGNILDTTNGTVEYIARQETPTLFAHWYRVTDVPVGTVSEALTTTCPAGTFAADGTQLVEATYPRLSAVIATSWKTAWNPVAGSSYTTTAGSFRIPDLRGAFLRGAGTPSGMAAVSVGGWQGDLTKKNGLAVAGGTASLGGTVTFSSNGHTHALDNNGGAQLQTSGCNGIGTCKIYANNATGPVYSTGGGGYQFGAFETPLSRNDASAASIGLVGRTSSNSAAASVSLSNTAASINGGDAETRPMSQGVQYCIKN